MGASKRGISQVDFLDSFFTDQQVRMRKDEKVANEVIWLRKSVDRREKRSFSFKVMRAPCAKPVRNAHVYGVIAFLAMDNA